MRIIQVITPTRISGAEKYLIQLSEELQNMGHEISIIIQKNTPLIDFLGKNFNIIPLSIEGKGNIFGYYRLKRQIEILAPDIIHSHLSTACFFSGMIGKALNIPVVSTAHAIDPPFPFKNSNKIIAVSHAVEEYLLKKNVSPSKITTIQNGIPLQSYSSDNLHTMKQEQYRKYNLSENSKVIATIAHFSSKKGHSILLKALSKLKDKDWTLFLIGEGKEKEKLVKLCKIYKIFHKVHFTGFIKNIYEILTIIDIVILPSIQGEGLPLSILEAQSQGIPVIASDLSGIKEVIIHQKNGFLFIPGDIEALTGYISQLLDNNQLRQSMGHYGKDVVFRKFNSKRNTDQVLSLYQSFKSKND